MVAGVVSGESIKVGVFVCLGHFCLPGAVSSAWHIARAKLSPPASASRPSSPPVPCTVPSSVVTPRAVRTPLLFWVVLMLFSPLNLFPPLLCVIASCTSDYTWDPGLPQWFLLVHKGLAFVAWLDLTIVCSHRTLLSSVRASWEMLFVLMEFGPRRAA